MIIHTRFALSRTGYFFHIGRARAAWFSWAYAHKQGGSFILCIKDGNLEQRIEQHKEVFQELL